MVAFLSLAIVVSFHMQTAPQEIQEIEVTPSFTNWLVAQVGRQDQVGKFAEIMKFDSNWPNVSDHDLNGEYLLLRSYVRTYMEESFSIDRIAAFEKAWEEFNLKLSEMRNRQLP